MAGVCPKSARYAPGGFTTHRLFICPLNISCVQALYSNPASIEVRGTPAASSFLVAEARALARAQKSCVLVIAYDASTVRRTQATGVACFSIRPARSSDPHHRSITVATQGSIGK